MANVSGHSPQAADYEAVGANKTLTAADSGKVFETSAADIVFTLPDATVAGMKGVTFTIVNGVLSAGTGLSLSPQAGDQIRGKGIATPADNKDMINTGATDALGDAVTVVCDGSTGYVAVNVVGTWAREA